MMATIGIIALIILTLAAFAAVEYSAIGVAIVMTIAASLIAVYAVGVPVFAWIIANPWIAVAYFGGYVLIGILWSFIKWDRFVARVAKAVKLGIEDYNKAHKTNYTIKDIHDFKSYRLDYEHYLDYFERPKNVPPIAINESRRITTWMMYWPWSLIWTFLREFVVHLFKNIFNALKDLYQMVVNRHFK